MMENKGDAKQQPHECHETSQITAIPDLDFLTILATNAKIVRLK